MLGTLLKHEWKDTFMLGLVCNGISLVLSVIGAVIVISVDWTNGRELTEAQRALMTAGIVGYAAIYFFSIFGIFMVMRYYFFVRYYKNLFTDQGYLMHTLPVKSTDLINSKLIIAIVWQFITGIVVAACAMILFAAFAGAMGEITPQDVMDSFKAIDPEWEEIWKNVPVMIAGVCCIILMPIFEILEMYTAVGIGQMSKKNRLLISILVLIGFYMAKRFLTSLIMVPFEFISFGMEQPAQATINAAALIFTLLLAGAVVGLYFLNKFFVEKKLNLE